jgi:hypothetical protein
MLCIFADNIIISNPVCQEEEAAAVCIIKS